MHKILTSLILVITLAASNVTQAGIADDARNIVSSSPFTTPELLLWTVEGIPSCLQWCVTGISFRLIIHPPVNISIETTPHIAHNSPDLLVMAHPNVGESPWREWSAIAGTAQKAAIKPIMRLMNGRFGHVVGGGESQSSGYGITQSTTFKEAQVIGHPLALVPLILSGMGVPTYLNPGPAPDPRCKSGGFRKHHHNHCHRSAGNTGSGVILDDSLSPEVIAQRAVAGVQNWIADWPNNAKQIVGFVRPEFLQAFAVVDMVKNVKKYIATFKSLKKIVSGGGAGFGVSLGADHFLCPTDVLPFVPYYLSAVDAFFWRNGFPITDTTKILSIMNPLSSDRIGGGLNIWGYTYPRHGFVENNNDQHVGVVIATRAADIVSEHSFVKNQHLRWPLPDRSGSAWQALYPTKSFTCSTKLDKESDTSTNGQYAWNEWRPYDCDMSDKGKLLTTVPLPSPICLPL